MFRVRFKNSFSVSFLPALTVPITQRGAGVEGVLSFSHCAHGQNLPTLAICSTREGDGRISRCGSRVRAGPISLEPSPQSKPNLQLPRDTLIIRQGDFSFDRRSMLCKHLFLGCGVLFCLQVLNLPTLFSPLVKVPPRGF